MGIGIGTATLAAAGANMGGGMIQGHFNRKLAREQNAQNIDFQNRTNQANWERDQELMRIQRYWAEQDWDKVNAYNHPTQQMMRFKEAGLNPHLIYGNTNNSPAAMLRTTPAQHTAAKAPQVDNSGLMAANETTMAGITGGIGNALNSYIALKSLENDTMLKQAATLRTLADVNTKNFDLHMKEELRDLTTATAKVRYETEFYNAQIKGSQSETELALRQSQIQQNIANTAKTDTEAKRANELFLLAQKENLLKQKDIDTLEKLTSSGAGMSYIIKFLELIIRAKTAWK
jgi:hypothetical protein